MISVQIFTMVKMVKQESPPPKKRRRALETHTTKEKFCLTQLKTKMKITKRGKYKGNREHKSQEGPVWEDRGVWKVEG